MVFMMPARWGGRHHEHQERQLLLSIHHVPLYRHNLSFFLTRQPYKVIPSSPPSCRKLRLKEVKSRGEVNKDKEGQIHGDSRKFNFGC